MTPQGWREAAGEYGKPRTHMSIADVVDEASLDEVRSYKKMMKRSGGQERSDAGNKLRRAGAREMIRERRKPTT